MRSVFVIQLWLLAICNQQSLAIIVSPCKVQNLITQPSYGTSLKTKGLVQIIQMPPVFVQNVMVGICENRNQNVSTGITGEFYSCQQRYSVIEVYIADASQQSQPMNNNLHSTLNSINSIHFVRESVIIESGCDFTFNLLPLMASVQAQAENPTGQAIPSQQQLFLRSPYHQAMPARPSPIQHSDPSAGVPVNQYHQPPNSVPNYYPPLPGTKGRSTADDDENETSDDGSRK